MVKPSPLAVAAIVGSLRERSINRGLLRAAIETAPAGIRITDVPIGELPLFNDDLEIDGGPAPVKAFRAALSDVDGILIVTPEYNYSMPGVLKNAFDWASRPTGKSVLSRKPAALIGASSGRSGTMRSQLHVRQVMGAVNLLAMVKPELYVTFGSEKFDDQGNLHDDRTREELKDLLVAFENWIQLISPKV